MSKVLAIGGRPLKYTSQPVSFVIVPHRVTVEPETRIRDRATIAPLLSPSHRPCGLDVEA